MPDLMERTVRSSYPKGHPWTLHGVFGQINDALAKTLGRIKALAFGLVAESQPISATTTLESWYKAFNLLYDPGLTVAELQARVSQVYTSLGGQGLAYINEQVQRAFPDVTVEEYLVEAKLFMTGIGMTGQIKTASYQSWVPAAYQDGSYPVFLYRVTGTVDSVDDLRRLGDILQKIAPLTHEPIFDSSVLDIPLTAMSGLARMGLARAGRVS